MNINLTALRCTASHFYYVWCDGSNTTRYILCEDGTSYLTSMKTCGLHDDIDVAFVHVTCNNCYIGVVVRMSTLDTNVDGSILSINMFSP